MTQNIFSLTLTAVLLSSLYLPRPGLGAEPLTLQYTEPATRWEQEALPIGNGQMGAMIFGGVQKEHLQFNEESLWVGDEGNTGAYQAFGDIFVELTDPANPPNEICWVEVPESVLDALNKFIAENDLPIDRLTADWLEAMVAEHNGIPAEMIAADDCIIRTGKSWRYLPESAKANTGFSFYPSEK